MGTHTAGRRTVQCTHMGPGRRGRCRPTTNLTINRARRQRAAKIPTGRRGWPGKCNTARHTARGQDKSRTAPAGPAKPPSRRCSSANHRRELIPRCADTPPARRTTPRETRRTTRALAFKPPGRRRPSFASRGRPTARAGLPGRAAGLGSWSPSFASSARPATQMRTGDTDSHRGTLLSRREPATSRRSYNITQ